MSWWEIVLCVVGGLVGLYAAFMLGIMTIIWVIGEALKG
jgi:hypothetical protein